MVDGAMAVVRVVMGAVGVVDLVVVVEAMVTGVKALMVGGQLGNGRELARGEES